MEDIIENFQAVRERIARAAARAGRSPEEVSLVAVTKTVELPRIEQAVRGGITVLGENRVQEARRKAEAIAPELGEKVEWHLVGTLQRNKAKYCFGLFHMIHSVDSFPLAQELSRRGEKAGMDIEVLVQVNLAGEEQKGGASKGEAIELLKEVSRLPHLKLRGLMTMPPFMPDPEDSRPYFQELRAIRDRARQEGLEEVRELSMGMTADFEQAVEEGATIVRVGTAIFGPRL
ncbi:MAG: YggS family pyridoxal phosphate-dependent enzyme [Nitrospinota bacterium]